MAPGNPLALSLLVKAFLLFFMSVALEFGGFLFAIYFFIVCRLTNRFYLPVYR